jgi:hypothetical protein
MRHAVRRSLIGFELYKLFSRKLIYIAFIFLVAATFAPSLYRVYTTVHHGGFSQDYQAKAVTDQQYKQASKELAKFQVTSPTTPAQQKQMDSDYSIVYAKGQSDQRNTQLSGLAQHIQALQHAGRNNFDYRVSSLEYRMLSVIKPYGFGVPDGVWGQVVGFYAVNGTVLMTAVILLGLSSMFNQEYGGMDGLIFTAKNGRRKLTTAKLAASFIYVVTWAVILSFINVASSMVLYGQFGSTSFPLQNWLVNSPYAWNMGQYFGVVLIYHIIGCVGFAMVILLLSSLFRSVLLPFFVGLCIMLLPMFLNFTLHSDSGWVKDALQFSYGTMMQVDGMQVGGLFDHFQAENLFGYPMLYPVSIVLVMAVLTTLAMIFTYREFRLRQVTN